MAGAVRRRKATKKSAVASSSPNMPASSVGIEKRVMMSSPLVTGQCQRQQSALLMFFSALSRGTSPTPQAAEYLNQRHGGKGETRSRRPLRRMELSVK